MKYKVEIHAIVKASSLLDACIKTSLIPGFHYSDISAADSHNSTGVGCGTKPCKGEFIEESVSVVKL